MSLPSTSVPLALIFPRKPKALALQFALKALFNVYNHVSLIKKEILEAFHSSNTIHHILLSNLRLYLSRLTCPTHERNALSFSKAIGSLDRLYFFSLDLQLNKRNEISKHLMTSFNLIFRIEEILSAHEKKKISSKVLTRLVSISNKLETSMANVKVLFLGMLEHYHDDENVISFLLRHHELVEECLETRYLQNFISKFFLNDVEKLKAFIHNKFSSRGFEKQAEMLNKLIETKCCSSSHSV